jgi:hypothetical protein
LPLASFSVVQVILLRSNTTETTKASSDHGESSQVQGQGWVPSMSTKADKAYTATMYRVGYLGTNMEQSLYNYKK